MATQSTHPDPPTITPLTPPPQHGRPTVVDGKAKTAPSRFVKSLTAKDVYFLAPDPSLVPRPLAFRKQTRIVTAPAVLQSGAVETRQAERRKEWECEEQPPACHFRDRPRSHQHAILDAVARVVADGLDASEVAKDMDMEWNELAQYMASFGVSARDIPSVLDQEIQLFYSSTPETHFNVREGHPETSGARALKGRTTKKWEASSYDGSESTHSRIGCQGVPSWIKGQGDVFRDNPSAVVTLVSGTHVENEDVYYDALESQDEITSQESKLTSSGSDSLTSYKDLAIPELHLPSIVGLVIISPLHANFGREAIDLGAPKTHASRSKRLFWNIPSTVWMILGVMVGRLLGILLAELHQFVLYH
ncbi:hypothetical protein AYL99_00164 [Fonsecaea erecta]|uniref:Uncharacterized protein n=1 Tax=Fonsecaea erecta TaxID=1367422 RepID=A0A178ZWX5_9EURO|nr:hypothetical protein AYL99_00164 [Fonsecaea erecta]OAP64192.1 hypothetical protein AYL99_00164 [Fonsecaea erecta]